MDPLIEWLTSIGPVGLLIARVLSVLLLYLIPGAAVDVLALGALDFWQAFVLSELGILIGAAMAFGIGRILQGPLKNLRSVQTSIRFLGRRPLLTSVWGWAIIRLLTNPLYAPLSYAAGIVGARFTPFMLGTLIGTFPTMILFFVAVHAGLSMSPWTGVSVALLLIGAFALAHRWMGFRFSDYLGVHDEQVEATDH